ncbi:MAG: hypothetical protein ACYDED_10265 [Ferrimicrobium sp.]
MRSIRPPVGRRQVVVRRYEAKPGEQLQFDWGIFSYTGPDGVTRHTPGLAAVLAYSPGVSTSHLLTQLTSTGS